MILIITCKGATKNGRFRPCAFFHEGGWNDGKLVEHQNFHESVLDVDYFWLGFVLSQPIGKYSGRDGKRD